MSSPFVGMFFEPNLCPVPAELVHSWSRRRHHGRTPVRGVDGSANQESTLDHNLARANHKIRFVRLHYCCASGCWYVALASHRAAANSLAAPPGMIQVDLAIAAKTFVNPIQLAINDSSHLATSQVISVTNKGPGSMIYTLSAVLGQGVGLYDDFVSLEAEPTSTTTDSDILLPFRRVV